MFCFFFFPPLLFVGEFPGYRGVAAFIAGSHFEEKKTREGENTRGKHRTPTECKKNAARGREREETQKKEQNTEQHKQLKPRGNRNTGGGNKHTF